MSPEALAEIDPGGGAVPGRDRLLAAAVIVLLVAGGAAMVVNLVGDGPIDVDPTATPTATLSGTPTDLRVTIHGDTRARVGRRITPYVQVLNQGKADADGTLVVTVPAAFELADDVTGCTADGRRLTCRVTPAATARTRTNVPLIARGGSGRLVAEVRNTAGDPDSSDDRASVLLVATGRSSPPTVTSTVTPTETPTVTEPTFEPTPQPTTSTG
jgi:hypothetical protein